MRKQMRASDHEIRNICDACKTCKDNWQIISHCFDECYWPIQVMCEVEEKRAQEAADEPKEEQSSGDDNI